MHSKTKDILLKVSRDLIDNDGLEAISMRTVGKVAGLSRSALYRHFDNKESLLAAIVIENFLILGGKINTLEDTAENPKDLLNKGLLLYYDFAIENPDHYQLMFNTRWDDSKYPEIRRAAFNVFETVSVYVSKAITMKLLSQELLIKKTAILYAFIHGLVELHLAGHNEGAKGLDDAKQLINHMVDTIL